jgi:hypothetical protein
MQGHRYESNNQKKRGEVTPCDAEDAIEGHVQQAKSFLVQQVD